eukprot:scaffold181_cov216-Ochromonas_danica.AAC.1
MSTQSKITKFFSPPANPERWLRDHINKCRDKLEDDYKLKQERQLKLDSDKALRMAKKKNEARRLQRTIKRNQEQLEEAADELKDNVLHFDDEEEDKVRGAGASKKTWVRRPEHWKTLVEFYRLAKNVRDVQTEYSDLFAGLSEIQLYKKLTRWAKELDRKKR